MKVNDTHKYNMEKVGKKKVTEAWKQPREDSALADLSCSALKDTNGNVTNDK